MDITDTQLLRELRRALDAVAGEGRDAQAQAVEETMRRYNATMPDVVRALNSVRERHRQELAGLAGRIDALASGYEGAQATADSVDRFLRGLGGSRQA
jgi:regulator of protease activity HflC (stomatin/prohibitin superfamily)